MPAARPSPAFFLPDFCVGRAALAVVLIVELVALLIALARQPITHNFWVDLAAISMFLLWIGLGSAIVLCRATPWLAKQSITMASTLALGLLAAVVMLVSEAVYQLGAYLTGGVPAMLDIFPEHHATFVLRNAGIGFIVSALALRYFYVSAESKRAIELAAQARINALQARIRPHFLFNSMNTIAALTRSNPVQAEQAVEDLADLFRANLSDARQRIRLSEELEVARVYQRIEQLRLGERLIVEWQVDSLPMDALVPSLLLQPLLENAIYHGIERLPHGGKVSIVASCANEVIRIAVSNPIADNPSANNIVDEHHGHKLALDNIQQRLALEWPGKAHVAVATPPGSYTVTLTFPYSKREL
jgi:two-component system, LytTR family, sensor histidine kinase AlgZ